MDDQVTIVEENPLGVVVAFYGNGACSAILHGGHDFVANGLTLAPIVTVTQHKEVGKQG